MRCCINARYRFHLQSLKIHIITDGTHEICALNNLIICQIFWPYRKQRIKAINYGSAAVPPCTWYLQTIGRGSPLPWK